GGRGDTGAGERAAVGEPVVERALAAVPAVVRDAPAFLSLPHELGSALARQSEWRGGIRTTLTNTASRRRRPCPSAARRCRARSSGRAAMAAASPAWAFSRSSAAHNPTKNRATAA